MKVKDGTDDDEFIITRHSQFNIPINIINIYGEVESRTKKNEVEDRWFRIVSKLKKIELQGEYAIIIGDLNKHVGNLIKDNNDKVSFGGKLIKEFLSTKKYVLLNSTSKMKGGPFTRYDPAAPNDDASKSCLDLIMISKELLKYVKEVVIDKKLNLTPGNPVGRGKMVYPDHYAIIFIMHNIPLATNRNLVTEKFKMWNLNKESGWEKFKKKTEVNEKFRKIVETDQRDPTIMMNDIDKELNKVKFKAFGKVTVRNELKTTKEMKKVQSEKKELLTNNNADDREIKIKVLEDKITDQVITNQRKKLEKELCLLKDKHKKKGKSAAIFHLKDKVVGKKKAVQEATVMKDPNTQEVLTKRKDIKEASLNYCVDLLTNRTAKAGFEEDVRLKDLVHEVRMAEDPDDDIKFSPEIFENSLQELKKKNKDNYEFVLKSGSDLKLALFKLFNLVWTYEEKPEQWRKTGIIQLYKGKGERNEFGNQRNIHTKVDIPKLFGHMVMSKAKDKIIQNMTKYQIGTKIAIGPKNIFSP